MCYTKATHDLHINVCLSQIVSTIANQLGPILAPSMLEKTKTSR